MSKAFKYKPVKIETFAKFESQNSRIGCHVWSVVRLANLAKDLPVMEIPLQHMNIYISYESMNMRELVEHMRSVMAADLSYPIILDEDGEIMDGRHRIMKALLEEHTTIKAVRFEINPTPCRVEKD